MCIIGCININRIIYLVESKLSKIIRLETHSINLLYNGFAPTFVNSSLYGGLPIIISNLLILNTF